MWTECRMNDGEHNMVEIYDWHYPFTFTPATTNQESTKQSDAIKYMQRKIRCWKL